MAGESLTEETLARHFFFRQQKHARFQRRNKLGISMVELNAVLWKEIKFEIEAQSWQSFNKVG